VISGIFFFQFNATYLFVNHLAVCMIAYSPISRRLVAVSARPCECSTVLFVTVLYSIVLRYVVLASCSGALVSLFYFGIETRKAMKSESYWGVTDR